MEEEWVTEKEQGPTNLDPVLDGILLEQVHTHGKGKREFTREQTQPQVKYT